MREPHGAAFEQRACAALEQAGLHLLAHNYLTRRGELDLVMRDDDTIVFVEVRYRRSATHGNATASVTARKRERVILAARQWLGAHPEHAQRPCRFDVVSYDGPAATAQQTWLRAAFDAS
jgi:putative endonuclease